MTNAVWGEAGPALPATLRPSLPKASFIPLLPLAGIVLLGKSSLLSLWASAPGEALAAPAPWLLGGSLLWLLGTLVITPLLVWLVMRASTRGEGGSPSAPDCVPRGVALDAAAVAQPAPPQWGRVVAGDRLDAPISGADCVAWGMWIVLEDGSILLRDARSAGFDVELHDGRRVRVPVGRIVVEGLSASTQSPIETADAFLLALRLRPPPPPQRVDHRDPFAGHAVHEIAFHVGDEVALRAEVARVPTSDAAAGYRRAARAELQVEGTPLLTPGRPQAKPAALI